MRPSSRLSDMFLRADPTDSGSISVARNFHPFDWPNNGKIADAPVPISIPHISSPEGSWRNDSSSCWCSQMRSKGA